MEKPVQYDGVDFTDDTDFVALAHKALLWQLGGSLPYDDDALDWVYRALQALAGTSHATKFIEGITACVTDEARMVSVRALSFIQSYPKSWGAERVVDLAAGDRKRFKGLQGWTESGGDLEWMLLRAVGARITIGDERAIELGKKEALNPGQPEALMAALTAAVPDWVVEHAEEIVRLRPQTAVPILNNLDPQRYDVAGVGIRIAPYAWRDPEFRQGVERVLDDAEAKQRILSAIPPP